VAGFVTNNFIPVKIHVKEQPKTFERFGVQWTPTLLVVDDAGKERHRFEGYLPVDEFLPQLELGLGQVAFGRGQFAEAERRLRELYGRYPASDVAPEALYWAGVSQYKATGNGAALGETARLFKQKYPNSVWAKKASVWGGS